LRCHGQFVRTELLPCFDLVLQHSQIRLGCVLSLRSARCNAFAQRGVIGLISRIRNCAERRLAMSWNRSRCQRLRKAPSTITFHPACSKISHIIRNNPKNRS
jgi:hypothetical protein